MTGKWTKPKFYFEPRALLGFLLVFIVILFLAMASKAYIGNLVSLSRSSSQSKQAVLHAERIKTSLAAYERDLARNTGPSSEPGTSYRNLLDEAASLAALTMGDSLFSDQSFQIQQEIAKLQPWPTGQDAAGSSVQNKINRIGSAVNRFQALENNAIQLRSETASNQYYRFEYSFIGMLVVVVMLLTVLILMLNRHLRERALTEQKLIKATDLARDLYQNAPCGYFSFDRGGTIDGVNNTLAGWLQTKPAQIAGHYTISEFIILTESSVLEHNLQFLREGHSISNQHGYIRRSGLPDTLPVVLNATPLWDHGQFAGARCTVFDSTEIQRAQAETKRTNSELEAFSYSVSHDLRAPLRSIGGYSEILKEDQYDRLDEGGKKAVDSVIRNARKMGQLIDDLLNFSRMSRREIIKLNIDMNLLVEEVIAELKENTITPPTFTVGELPVAWADRSMLRQVLINLLSNAIKYSGKKTESVIDVFSERKDQTTIFHVRDNGSGFDMIYYTKLFGVFQRLHRENEFEGTGVGLALSKRIIEKHGGSIWADSSVGHGATFSFSIPEAT